MVRFGRIGRPFGVWRLLHFLVGITPILLYTQKGFIIRWIFGSSPFRDAVRSGETRTQKRLQFLINSKTHFHICDRFAA